MVARSEKLSPTRPSFFSEWKTRAVEGDDAGRLLAAMLQGVQAERRDGRGVRMAEDAEDAAFLAQRVAVEVKVGPRGIGLPRLGSLRHRTLSSARRARKPYVGSLWPAAIGRDHAPVSCGAAAPARCADRRRSAARPDRPPAAAA